MAASIHSVVTHNPDYLGGIHVMVSGLGRSDREKLESFGEGLGIPLHIHTCDESCLKSVPRPRHYPRAVFNRLILCDALPADTGRVLYLDSDIICQGDLSELMEFDLEGKAVAAVPDSYQEERLTCRGLSGKFPYFNSGVMLVDIAGWQEIQVTGRVFKVLQSDWRPDLVDQDALNVVLEGNVAYLDRKWNEFPDAGAECVLLHFAGPKPWQAWSRNYKDSRFEEHLKATPWPDWKYKPQTRGDRRKTYSQLCKEKKRWASWMAYVRYFFTPKG